MFDGRRGTLLGSGRPAVAGAARGGKGFLKRRSSLPGPGGSPRGADQSDGGYHILTNVRWSATTYTHTHRAPASVVRTLFSSPRLDLIPFLLSYSSGSRQSTALLFILPDIHAIWQVIPATSHSHTISQTSPPITSTAPRYDWAGFHRLLSFI